MKMRDLWFSSPWLVAKGKRIPPHPRATQMVIKAKEMQKHGFIRI